jgi:exosome complex RNA-binding protein Csl4
MMPDSESGLDDSLYGDEAPAPKEEPAQESVDEQEAANPVGILPTSLLGKGVKAGDTVMVKIVKVRGDETEVEVSSADTEETTETTDETAGEPLPEEVEV